MPIKNFLKQDNLQIPISMKKRLQILIGLLILNVDHGQSSRYFEEKEAPRKSMGTLVDDLYKKGFYKSKIVKNAMLQVDRKFFCECFTMTYDDKPFPLTYGSFIGAPSLHATALQLMKRHLRPAPTPTKALDIGCGSGYLTAAMASMMSQGLVIGIDHMKAIANKAYSNIRHLNPKLLETKVRVVAADGRRGYAQMAPYDVIHCGAFAETIPDAFKKQLKPGGRLVMALGKPGATQQLITADLGKDGSWTIKNVTEVSVPPLTDPNLQIGK